jgi:antigen flippase
LGALVLLVLSLPISRVSFGTDAYVGSLALLSVAILLTAVADGQKALIQGLRRISDLAAVTIWGGVLGMLFSIPIVFLFGEKGIVPFLITISALATFTSWRYAREIRIEEVDMPLSVVWTEARALLRLGVVFMASGLMASAVAFFTRVMVIRQMGLDAAGLYQAAFAVSGVYVGFILGAMGADYYPRLTAVSANNEEVNRLVNEQTEASLLLGVPGILGTLTFAPWVIHLLYSAQFDPAVDLLRWQVLGVLGRVISWPIGFVILAKGRGKVFFYTELIANSLHLCLIWFGMKWFGLNGLGMAFFVVYAFYLLMILGVVQHLSGFIWTKDNLRRVLGAILVTAAVFLGTAGGLHTGWGMTIGGGLTGSAVFYAVREMIRRTGCTGLSDAWSKTWIYFKTKAK